MKLRSVTLREVQMQMLQPFETSFGVCFLRRILLIEADVDGTIGWGECVGAASVAAQQETNNNPNSQRRYQSGYGLIGSESPHPVHSLSIGLLRSTCRPIHLTAGLRIRVSRNGANGVLKLPAEIACGPRSGRLRYPAIPATAAGTRDTSSR